MASFINTNISSLNAQRNLTTSQSALATSLTRLSSGLRINSAKDDAAGLAISERLTSQIRGSDQAGRNANDGISLAQTAEGDLAQIGNNLQRIRELAVQSANGSNSASDRASINNEAKALSAEIDRVAQSSSFNGNKLLDGTFNSQSFQVGANGTSADSVTITSISSARIASLGGSGTSTSTTTTGTATTTALAAGDLTLNGVQVGATSTGAAPGQSSASAFSIAAAINSVSSTSSVTATANATTVSATATTFAAVTTGATLTVNGIQIGSIAAGGNVAGFGANTAAAINAVSGQSGVSAVSDSSGQVTLTAADGRDVILGAGFTAATTGLAAGTTHGTVSLASNATGGISVGGGGVAKAGLALGVVAPSTTLTVNSISSIDLSTATGATNALAAIDGALTTINSSRAALGAVQNRFASVVTSLQTTSENLSASRSRIQDTDFAHETASLTRGQILQQAGTAILAQANSLPNGVLSLLR
ncbi:flagellin [Actimicrobium sp. GrIS 1.19]|uniref:flagellin N-terminal helical domain-containing protein n=1 Tax=Actimicrobium sp. GrIS 1.19 TaxID=3071708 RepID=UPI002E0C4046|nr:flagellin [Actimicrobium sp. GrIS 1.19]